MPSFEFKLIENPEAKNETLHISSKIIGRARRKRFKGFLMVMRFIDKDTKQIVLYAPSFEVSGYGETEDKAFEMLKNSLDNTFSYLSNLSLDDLRTELNKLGWRKNRLRNKDFSRLTVDEDGNLNGLNAENNKVERLALVA